MSTSNIPEESSSTQTPQRFPIPSAAPRATYIFLSINIVVFVAQFGLQLAAGQVASNLVFVFGAKINEFIVAGQYYRLVTMIFLHGGLVHLAFNSYALYIIGPTVERPFGSLRFLIVYLLSGVTGSIFSFIFNPHPAVGASGAIFGLIGASGVYLFTHRRVFGALARQRLNSIAMITIINLVIGLNPGIDNWAHIGGLIGGGVLAWLIEPVWRLESDYSGDAQVVDSNPLHGRWPAVLAYGFAIVAGIMLGTAVQR